MMIPINDKSIPEQLISRAVRTLDSDLRQVLILHNGNGDTPGLSFEELAGRLDRSSQDLIAVEKTAIRNLRHPTAARLMVEALKKGDSVIWQALADENNVVYKDNLNQQIAAGLPGELLIAIKCLYDNVLNWLNNHAYQNRIAWYRSEYPENVVIGVIEQLRELKGRIQFPFPFQRLAEQLNAEKPLLKQVLALSKNRFEIYRGYVCGVHARARTLRAVRLHLMFFYRYPNQILSLEQIHTEYLDTYSDDDAILRDIFLAMGDNPHIFMRLGSLGWYSMMTVADPRCWPVPDDEKRSWLENKKWKSSYYLRHDCKHRIWFKIPALRDLLALSFCISRTAGMNWIRVNRAAGYYLFDQHSVTHLALLIELGALKSTDHWQNPHQIGPEAEYIFKKLMDAFQIDPTSDWDSDVGLELRKHLLDIDVDQDLGWVNVEDLALLSKKLAGEPLNPPVDGTAESNAAPNLLPKQLELPF